MRFIHTADWHIGEHRHLRSPGGEPAALERQQRMITRIFEAARDLGAGVVVVAGDIFHRKDTTAQERDMVISTLLRETETDGGTALVAIPGNHDRLGTDYTQLRLLNLLASKNRLKYTHIVEDPMIARVRTGAGELDFLCIPSGHDINEWTARLLPHSRPGAVVVAHESILGARLDTGGQIGVGRLAEMHGQRLDLSLPVLYWALGDIHRYQALGANAFYSGAPVQHTHGDSLPKGVLLVDTDRPHQPQLIDLGLEPFVTLAEVPDAWPRAASIRLRMPRPPEGELPPHVTLELVPEAPTATEVHEAETEAAFDIFDGLDRHLAAAAIPEGLVPMARAEAEDIRRHLGL